jgi:hypothetical protein
MTIIEYLFLLNFKDKKKIEAYYNMQQINTMYLENVYKIKLKEKNINAITILPYEFTKSILMRTRYKSYKRFNIKYFNEVAYLFVLNIFLKNSKHICKYIKKKLESVHFKRHRAYFLFFNKILSKFIRPNFKILQIRGITLKFKGKLGRGGNSRTKTMFYRRGLYSLSNKSLSLNRNK